MLRRSTVLWDPMPLAHVVAFYLGIPLLMSFMFGINSAGMARHMPILIGVIYWAGIWVPFWLLLDATTRSAALLLRSWSPPLWLILLLGSAVAVVVFNPYVMGYIDIMRPTGVGFDPSRPPLLPMPLGKVERMLGFAGTPLFWITINYYYDRILGIPRYRGRLVELVDRDTQVDQHARAFDAAPSSDAASGTPPVIASDGTIASPTVAHGIHSREPELIRYLPRSVGHEVIALQAEDHYVRVFTTLGSCLIRYRFGDALRDLADRDGLRVHRSFWVLRSAVIRLRNRDGATVLVLPNDLEVPVSRAYREIVRNSGLMDA